MSEDEPRKPGMSWRGMFTLVAVVVGFVITSVMMGLNSNSHDERVLTVEDLRGMLALLSQEGRFVVYRAVVSERQDPDGFCIDEDGNLNPEGELRLDYVGICEVEASVPMDQVKLEVNGTGLRAVVPDIDLNPVINYEMSFAWSESDQLPNQCIPLVLEMIRGRAVEQAKSRGIIDQAKMSVDRWLKAFLKPFGYGVAVEFGA